MSHHCKLRPRKFSKIHFSRTAYYNFELKRLLTLYLLTLQIPTNLVLKSKFVIYENRNNECLLKITKIVICVVQRNSDDEKCLQKA